MLQRLFVKNYVLIEELEINLDKGLTIITGETGAGKSILLGALGLILGQRADSGALLKKDQKCIVEGVFNLSAYQLENFFTEHELDYSNDTTIRREINPEGKSRAFINDTPVNLNTLKELSSRLVDIHSQHETLLLNTGNFQLNLVDAYASNQALKNIFLNHFTEHKKLIKELTSLEETEQRSRADEDYFKFQFKELEELNLVVGEQDLLEQEEGRLTHAEEIRIQLEKSVIALNGADENLITNLNLIYQNVLQLNRYDQKYTDLAARIKTSLLELKDITEELEKSEQELVLDPGRLEIVQDRLSMLYKLQQKHRVTHVDDLIALRDEFDQKLSLLGSIEDQITQKKERIEAVKKSMLEAGIKLTKSRVKVIPEIEDEVNKQLADLGMQYGKIKVDVLPFDVDHFVAEGMEKIQFLFSANKGIDFRELSKVASGGELSRLMLVMKSLLARLTAMPTVIFDEIDTGISGETAAKVGSILKLMAKNHQVLAISHLPQMASKGDFHFMVYKEVKKGSTRTFLRKLSQEERINEVARMLSGEELTEAAIGNARSLLSSN
ncbi:DNA repair protein RecN [soil metagenome]